MRTIHRLAVVTKAQEKQMARITTWIASVSVGGILILGLNASTGKVVARSSQVKVREMQVIPWSIQGMLGIGDVLYRAEYYTHPGSVMSECASYTHESLHKGQQVELRRSGSEIWIRGALVFSRSDPGWKRHRDGYRSLE